jgi:drug/metabolite transporter (DMT)-like permease
MTAAIALSPSRAECTPGGSGEPSPANGRGALLCLVSAAGFGVAAVFAKESYRAGLNVPTMLAVRFAIAAAVFWALVAWRRPRWPARRTVFIAIGLGSIGYALQAVLYFSALTKINASLTSLLLYLYPALVTGLAVLLRRERPDGRRLAALLCSAAGLVLVLGAGSAIGSVAGFGVLLALASALTYALYLTVAAGLPEDLDVFLLSAIVCTSAAVTMTAVGSAMGTLHAPQEPIGWFWTAMLAVVSTVVPIAALLAGIRLVGAPTAAILSCAEPAVTVVTTALLYSERLTVGQIIGGTAIVGAVLLLQMRRPAASA